MTTQDIKNVNTSDIRATYKVGNVIVKFDAKDWEWIAVNQFGFGVDSDLDLVALLTRLIEE